MNYNSVWRKFNFLYKKINKTIFYKLIESFEFDANWVIQNVHCLLEENWENSHGGNTVKKKEKISAHVHTYTAHVSTSYESYISTKVGPSAPPC